MSTLTLAGAEHLSRLLPMVAACHEELGIASTDSRRRAAIEPLLRGTPLGALWLIGPKMAPVGYMAAGFGWSLALGGPEARLDEFWIRPPVRGRGMGGQALEALAAEVQRRGALALAIAAPGERAAGFCARHGFARAAGSLPMTRRL